MDEQDYSDRLMKEVKNIQHSMDLQKQISEDMEKKIKEIETINKSNNLIKQYNDEM